MLLLTRKLGEVIRIGDDTTITVVDVKGGRVTVDIRVGFDLRKRGENVRIGDRITITAVELRGGHVKLGIDAPLDVIVHREEIWQRIQQEKLDARRARPARPNPAPTSPGDPTTGPSGEAPSDDRA